MASDLTVLWCRFVFKGLRYRCNQKHIVGKPRSNPGNNSRTNGYCMWHAQLGRPVDGILESEVEVDPTAIELPDEYKPLSMLGFSRLGPSGAWNEFMEKFQPGDKMIHYSTRPSSREQDRFVVSGYAIARNGNWVSRFVVRAASNPEYEQDIEEIIPLDEVMNFHFVWDALKAEFKEGDTVVKFTSSPFSWECFCGCEEYRLMRNDEWIGSCVTMVN